ncbi:hypothetical protein NQ317_006854 [Molorchus minor]|uniref:Uncharacterized protein n=1 Tax=Molorchus minor TaxID=1323400 RepID=A0ABQ9K066_9CUCU|nr:hypothetical protein NQ317_006854 [Molorchus minor]
MGLGKLPSGEQESGEQIESYIATLALPLQLNQKTLKNSIVKLSVAIDAYLRRLLVLVFTHPTGCQRLVDPSKKNELQYKQDLNILYHVLQAFPGQNNTWKIVGSDISRVTKEPENNMIEELKGIITAVMWEPERITQESFPEKDTGWHTLNQENKPAVGMWTTVPKSAEPISFSSALLWARQVGDAAKLGYEVIFRQPRLHEMFSDTPWEVEACDTTFGRSFLIIVNKYLLL